MKKRAVLADTGPLYAAVDCDDAYHEQAQQQLERLAAERWEVFVTYSTLLEAYSLILFRLGKQAAVRWLGEMAAASLVNPSAEDYRQATMKAAAFADQAITLFDATVAVMALRLKLEVWTYDHHFDLMRVGVWR